MLPRTAPIPSQAPDLSTLHPRGVISLAPKSPPPAVPTCWQGNACRNKLESQQPMTCFSTTCCDLQVFCRRPFRRESPHDVFVCQLARGCPISIFWTVAFSEGSSVRVNEAAWMQCNQLDRSAPLDLHSSELHLPGRCWTDHFSRFLFPAPRHVAFFSAPTKP